MREISEVEQLPAGAQATKEIAGVTLFGGLPARRVCVGAIGIDIGAVDLADLEQRIHADDVGPRLELHHRAGDVNALARDLVIDRLAAKLAIVGKVERRRENMIAGLLQHDLSGQPLFRERRISLQVEPDQAHNHGARQRETAEQDAQQAGAQLRLEHGHDAAHQHQDPHKAHERRNQPPDRHAFRPFTANGPRLSRALIPSSSVVFTKSAGDRLPSQSGCKTGV